MPAWLNRAEPLRPAAAPSTSCLVIIGLVWRCAWGQHNTTKRRRHVTLPSRHLSFDMVAELWTTQLDNDIRSQCRHQDNNIRVSFRFSIRMIGQRHQIQNQLSSATTAGQRHQIQESLFLAQSFHRIITSAHHQSTACSIALQHRHQSSIRRMRSRSRSSSSSSSSSSRPNSGNSKGSVKQPVTTTVTSRFTDTLPPQPQQQQQYYNALVAPREATERAQLGNNIRFRISSAYNVPVAPREATEGTSVTTGQRHQIQTTQAQSGQLGNDIRSESGTALLPTATTTTMRRGSFDNKVRNKNMDNNGLNNKT